RIIKVQEIAVHFHKQVGLIDNPNGASILIDHGKLRDIRSTHPLERGQQRVRWSNGNYLAGFVTMRDEVAQIAMRRTMNEPLLRHPEIVEHLGKIFVPGIDHKADEDRKSTRLNSSHLGISYAV